LTHAVCQAAITEEEAYQLSRSKDYEEAARSMKKGEDLRCCKNRHAACYRAFNSKLDQPSITLDLRLLRVCRQVYVEASPVLWGTNTWAFHDGSSWKGWRLIGDENPFGLNATQRGMIKAVHLAPNLLRDPLTKKDLSLFKALEKVYIDVTLKSTLSNPAGTFDQDFLSRKSCKLNEFATTLACLLISAFQFQIFSLPRIFLSSLLAWRTG
jgi:hypothetical protein